MITPLPGVTPLVPGSCTLPLPGIDAAIVDETGNEVPNGQGGVLVIRKPWPSMIRTVWGNPERFRKGYYPDELGGTLYLAGDGAIRDPDTGYFRKQVFSRPDHPLEIVSVELPAGQRVVLPAASYAHIRQIVWVQTGSLVIIEAGERHALGTGDCFGFGPPSEVIFANETATPCTYVVALARS